MNLRSTVYNDDVNKKNRYLYYAAYTLCFVFLAAVILYLYYSQGKSMIEAGGDGFRQHFRGLLYYSDFLKKILNNFLHGHFVIPEWDFVIGEGSDILTSLHYYCIGDIFTFFSIFCPHDRMYLYYDLATLARMYCSGLFFSSLCLYKGKKNYPVILGAAILYAFCPLSIENMSAHVFFISAAVYLPLIILGVEKIVAGDKPYLLSTAVMLSALSNIYFFYMNVLSTVFYCAIRVLFMDKEWKERVLIVLRVALYSFIGVMMSAVVFLPMLNTMLSNTRLDTKVASGLFYDTETYIRMYEGLAFGGDNFFGGFSAVGLLAILLLFLKKKNPTLKVLFIMAFIFGCLPFFGKLYNALVYPTARWLYALSLIVSYITVEVFDEKISIDKHFWFAAAADILYYVSCLIIDPEEWQIHGLFLALSIVLILAVIFDRFSFPIRDLSVLGIAYFCIFFAIMFIYSPMFYHKAETGTDLSRIAAIDDDEWSIFNEIEDDSFFRYTGKLTTNESVQGRNYSTQYYWSVVNDYVVSFRKQLGLADNSNHHYSSYDDRFILNNLAGARYYVRKDDCLLPYGFGYLGNFNNYEVYKNDDFHSIIHVYDSYIPFNEWESYDVAQRNEAIAQAAVLNEETDKLQKAKIEFAGQEIPYELSVSGDLSIADNRIYVNVGGNIELACKSDLKGEYYVLLEGIDSDSSIYIGAIYEDAYKSFEFKGHENLHYTDRHDYLLNLGYREGIDGIIDLEFTGYGVYEFDKIRIICQPLDQQIAYLNKLDDIKVKTLETDDNRVLSEIELNEDRLVCFAIPYSKGWQVYVDGKKADLLECDVQYMGLFVEKGGHQIELRYSRPFGTIGLFISISGLVLLGGIGLFKRKNRLR